MPGTGLISHYCGDAPWFRWHDSGDIMGVVHLARIVRVCERTPTVKHWLPTHEPYLVRAYLRNGGAIPDNLVVRISADHFDRAPEQIDGVQHLPTSTVHSRQGLPVVVSERRADSIECRATYRNNECGSCRACWSPKVRNVSYVVH